MNINKGSIIKVVVGLAVLLAAFTYRIYKADASAMTWPEPHTVDQTGTPIPWASFPTVTGTLEDTPPNLIFVFAINDCDKCRALVDQLAERVAVHADITMAGVFVEASDIAARRYLRTETEARPMPILHDAAGWFREHFDLQESPALLFDQGDGTFRVMYPSSGMELAEIADALRLPLPAGSL